MSVAIPKQNMSLKQTIIVLVNKLALIKWHHHHCIVSMVTIVIVVMILTLITLVIVLMILVVITIVNIIAIVIVVLIITKDQGGSHLRAAGANATITRLAG